MPVPAAPQGPFRHDGVEADVRWLGWKRGVSLALESEADDRRHADHLAQCSIVVAPAASEPDGGIVPRHHWHEGDDSHVGLDHQGGPDRFRNPEASSRQRRPRPMLGKHHFIRLDARQEHPLAVVKREANQRRSRELTVGRHVGEDGARLPVRHECTHPLDDRRSRRIDGSGRQRLPAAAHLTPNGVL